MHAHGSGDERLASDRFPTEARGLPEASWPELVELAAGDAFDLKIRPVAKRIGDLTVRMLGYNGSIPGPTLRVSQGSAVTVRVTNRGDHETTVHWHGLRLENRFDGTHDTQADPDRRDVRVRADLPGSRRLLVPPAHPRGLRPGARPVREHPRRAGRGRLLAPCRPRAPAHARRPPRRGRPDRGLQPLRDDARGDGPLRQRHAGVWRAGPLARGSTGRGRAPLPDQHGEHARLHVALPGARTKLVGGDSGRYEHEALVDDVLIAPSERVVLDVLFDEPGKLTLEHRTPDRTYALAAIAVRDEPGATASADAFLTLRTNADLVAERARIAELLDAPPDKTLSFVAEMDLGTPEGPVVYACPMHPEVVADEPASCPKCGMKLLPTKVPADTTYVCPMHADVTSDAPDRCPRCGMRLVPASLASGGAHDHGHEHGDGHGEAHAHEAPQGIEWEDDMVEVNRMTTPATMRWKLVDRSTGAENAAIDWRFEVGDQVKIRLVNELDSDHPMPHPFHIHGAGRFLILARGGVAEPNLVWKDTVLVRTGETVDLLLDVTNPGTWMAHCHIAEHHEGGMMLTFRVDEPSSG